MFGIGMPEMLLILAVALIVLGPKKLPDLAKSLGRAVREFKRATTEFKDSMEIDTELKDVKQKFDEVNHNIRETIDGPAESPAEDQEPINVNHAKPSQPDAKTEQSS